MQCVQEVVRSPIAAPGNDLTGSPGHAFRKVSFVDLTYCTACAYHGHSGCPPLLGLSKGGLVIIIESGVYMNHIMWEEGRDITDGFAAVHDTLNSAPVDVAEYPANTWGHYTTILAFVCFLLSF